MLLNSLAAHAEAILSALPPGIQAHSALAAASAAAVIALLVWRWWRFTITPALYPDDPKELPYWIPFLGHGIAFFGNSSALLSRAGKYFGNTKEPFAITVANSKIYVITKSRDVAEAYRNTDTLSFNEFVMAMMRACGNTEHCVQAMYTPLPKDKDGFPNPHGKPLATLARQMHIHQLYPGDNLDFLESQFHDWFVDHLKPDVMQRFCPYATAEGSKGTDAAVVLPLMEWCSDFFTRAGQRAYFGDALAAIDPELTKVFIIFDELSWQVLYQYPSFLTREMKTARDRIQRAIKRYIQIPQGQRGGDAWFTKAMENEMRALGIGEDDIATMMVTIYWGINTNTRKAAFWLITYLLHRPSLIDAIRAETSAAFIPSPTEDPNQPPAIDLARLRDGSCPLLDSLWNETIRMSAYSASVRFITHDTVIGGKTLRRGNRLMIPYRQLHFDEDVFGAPADAFRPERFAEKANLTRSDNWRPFGGGSTMCPGRYVAKRAVMLFVAMLLREFDVEMVGGPATPVPDAEQGKPVLGIMSVKEGQDLMVRLTRRKVGEKGL